MMRRHLLDPFEPHALPDARAAETPGMPQAMRANAAPPDIASGETASCRDVPRGLCRAGAGDANARRWHVL